MEITAFLIFHSLTTQVPVEVAMDAANCTISQVQRYQGTFAQEHTLYLVDTRQWPVLPELPPQRAALLFQPDSPPALPRTRYGCIGACAAPTPEALMERCTNAILSIQSWNGRLLEAHSADSPLPLAMPLMALLLSRPYCLIDSNSHVLYVSEDWPQMELPLPLSDTAGVMVNDNLFSQRVRQPQVFSYAFPGAPERYWCCGMRDGAAVLMMPAWEQELPNVPRSMLQMAAELIGRLIPHYRAAELIQRQNDAMHQMFRALLFEPSHYTTTDAERVLQDYGWKLNEEYTVVEVGFPRGSGWRDSVAYLCTQLERLAPGSCAIDGHKGIVWIFNRVKNGTSLQRQAFTAVVSMATERFRCHAGVSYSFNGFWYIRVCYQQANAALNLGRKAHPERQVFHFRDYTLDFIFHRLTSGFFLPYMYHSAVFTVINYDMEHGTDYFRTLHAYADCAGNISQAAEKLFIHRTTLIRRLERISELAARDITRPDDLFLLQFSFHVINRIHKNCTAEELMQEIERTYYKMNTESSEPFWLEP